MLRRAIQIERVAHDLRDRGSDVVRFAEVLPTVLKVGGGILHLRDREQVEVAAHVEDDDVHALGEAAKIVPRRPGSLAASVTFNSADTFGIDCADRRLRIAVRDVRQRDRVVLEHRRRDPD